MLLVISFHIEERDVADIHSNESSDGKLFAAEENSITRTDTHLIHWEFFLACNTILDLITLQRNLFPFLLDFDIVSLEH